MISAHMKLIYTDAYRLSTSNKIPFYNKQHDISFKSTFSIHKHDNCITKLHKCQGILNAKLSVFQGGHKRCLFSKIVKKNLH